MDAQTGVNLCYWHVLMDTFFAWRDLCDVGISIGVNVCMDDGYLHGYAHAYVRMIFSSYAYMRASAYTYGRTQIRIYVRYGHLCVHLHVHGRVYL